MFLFNFLFDCRINLCSYENEARSVIFHGFENRNGYLMSNDEYSTNGSNGSYSNGSYDDVQLSDRQAEIIVLIAKGEPNRIIAQKLGLSVHTVDAYCKRIYTKFETASRVTAAVRAAQRQLLPLI